MIGGGQAPAWEGAAVHRWSLARLDAQPEHVHVRVGDRFWMSAPEGIVPQGLAEALIALSAVVPGSSTVVRARGDPMPLPGVRARHRRSDPASVESGGPAVWAPPSGRGGAAPGQQRLQAVCAKCSRQMCRAVVLFLVAECAQTTPMIAPLPGDPKFSI